MLALALARDNGRHTRRLKTIARQLLTLDDWTSSI
jgi:hypothetical protein